MRTNIFGKQQKKEKIHQKRRKMMTNHDFLDNLANNQHQKMLREIANDNQTPKKRDSLKETELFEIDEIISETEPMTLNEF
ncbi:MAG: hypothetical protein CBE21_10860 [Proteobacteria bacterium TMED261]|nr:MAG: hypothetical protein CBE21_10860 [Proteobacteria bacterium TMED261]